MENIKGYDEFLNESKDVFDETFGDVKKALLNAHPDFRNRKWDINDWVIEYKNDIIYTIGTEDALYDSGGTIDDNDKAIDVNGSYVFDFYTDENQFFIIPAKLKYK